VSATEQAVCDRERGFSDGVLARCEEPQGHDGQHRMTVGHSSWCWLDRSSGYRITEVRPTRGPVVTRVALARAEIARRRALAEAATTGPRRAWNDGHLSSAAPDTRLGGLLRPTPVADLDHHQRLADACYIAANDPAHVLRVLAAADAALNRHARTHVCQARWLDDTEAAAGDTVGRYIWPHLICIEAQAVLDLYAPQETT
jgi:hypothetical protein